MHERNEEQVMSDDGARTWVFFYGTFMNADVLARHGVFPVEVVPAKLTGFALSIRPRVNLAKSVDAVAYGALALVSQAELDGIYSGLERDFGLVYEPETVLAETMAGARLAARCYIAPVMSAGPADPNYVRELAACVRAHGLPESYAVHVESFGAYDDHGEHDAR